MLKISRLQIVRPRHCQGGVTAPILPPLPLPFPVPPVRPPVAVPVVVQIIFHTPTGMVVIDGNGSAAPDGSITVTTPPFTPPPKGTVVQIVVFGPGGRDTTIDEGSTGDVGPDGSLTINSAS